MNKPVSVTFDATANKWHAENPVVITAGITTIEWTVQLANPSQGSIEFGTDPAFQGIKFNRGWAGSHPKGGPNLWTTTIENVLKPGDPNQNYHYTVNTMYQSDSAVPATKKSWDPDVEEEGPPPV